MTAPDSIFDQIWTALGPVLGTVLTVCGVIAAGALAFLGVLATARAQRRGQDVSARSSDDQREQDRLVAAAARSDEYAQMLTDDMKDLRVELDRRIGEERARTDIQIRHVRAEARTALRGVISVLQGTVDALTWYRAGAKPPPPRDVAEVLREAQRMLDTHVETDEEGPDAAPRA